MQCAQTICACALVFHRTHMNHVMFANTAHAGQSESGDIVQTFWELEWDAVIYCQQLHGQEGENTRQGRTTLTNVLISIRHLSELILAVRDEYHLIYSFEEKRGSNFDGRCFSCWRVAAAWWMHIFLLGSLWSRFYKQILCKSFSANHWTTFQGPFRWQQ